MSSRQLWRSLRWLNPLQSQAEVLVSGLEAQERSSAIPSLRWETKGCDLHGRLMDLMWWEMGGFDGRLGLILFGNERDRLKTPTIFELSYLFF